MVDSIADAVSRIRQPEYTGTNRCMPCTIVNSVIAAGIAGTLAWAVSTGFGLLALGLLIGVIYLRGYLVPGTPTLTKTYLPAPLLRPFGKDSPQGTLGDLDAEGIWNVLEDGGVVDRRNDAVRLSAEFRDRWRAEIRANRDRDLGERDVATMMDAEDVVQRGERAFSVGGNQLLRWDSTAALLADAAAAAVFRERFEDWPGLDRRTRRDLLGRLRLLLDRCPICDGPTRRENEHVDPCCQRPHTAVWTECRSCGAFLAELSVPGEPGDDDLRLLIERADSPD